MDGAPGTRAAEAMINLRLKVETWGTQAYCRYELNAESAGAF